MGGKPKRVVPLHFPPTIKSVVPAVSPWSAVGSSPGMITGAHFWRRLGCTELPNTGHIGRNLSAIQGTHASAYQADASQRIHLRNASECFGWPVKKISANVSGLRQQNNARLSRRRQDESVTNHWTTVQHIVQRQHGECGSSHEQYEAVGGLTQDPHRLRDAAAVCTTISIL